MNDGGPHNMDVVFGYIVYHALRGDCMTARALPEEDYFLDFIFNSFGSDNITIHGTVRNNYSCVYKMSVL